jgi:hypothetical protein
MFAFDFFLSSAHGNAPRERPRWPGLLQSSKDRAKPIVVDFVRDFRFRQWVFAAVLGSRLGFTSKFYAAASAPS